MKMKKMNLLLAVAVVTILALSVSAQDTSTSQPMAPSSQTTVSGNSRAASNDGNLTQQLQSRFGQDPAFANVQVSVSNGTAMITGSVPAKADIKRAKEMAKSLAGVKHVKEQLTINPSAGSSPSSSKDNNPTNASLSSGSGNNSTASAANSSSSASTPPDQNAAAAAPNSTNPANGQTSATSNNPNSQASSTTGTTTASSVPQNTGSAANKNNMAGQGPTSAQSSTSTPTATGASGSTPSTSQSAVGSGAIGANAGGSTPSPSPTGDMGVSVNDTATLQNQIQNALQNEPTLRNDNLNVSVTDSTIELSGNVQNGKEKQTASRIASSFAGNRRVKDRITLSGKGTAANTPGGLDANPASNANPNPNAQNPSANNPKTNGDASANPR